MVRSPRCSGRRRPRRLARPVLAAVLAALLFPAAGLARRLVAVGDVHGAYDELRSILRAASLIDEQDHWVGGDTLLIQTGDFLDRGGQIKETVGLLRRLMAEAPARGGEVVVLLGNHEAMNLLGITRDVAPEAFAQFAGEDAAKRRSDAYRGYLEWLDERERSLAGLYRPARPDPNTWNGAHPLGEREYVAEMSAQGGIGAFLRSLPGAFAVEDTLFVHGGLSWLNSQVKAREINERLWDEMRRYDRCRQELEDLRVIDQASDTTQMIEQGTYELERISARLERRLPPDEKARLQEAAATLRRCTDWQQWYLVSADGPLWHRGLARWGDEADRAVALMLERQGVERVVVGHTPQADGRIKSRLGGKVVVIDTGMLARVYRGAPSALELDSGELYAIYRDQRGALRPEPVRPPAPPAWPAKDGATFPYTSEAEIEGFLAAARVVSSEVLTGGITRPRKLLLRHGAVEAYAVFRTVDEELRNYRTKSGRLLPVFRDQARFEVAAYRLDRRLGMFRVPPTIERTLDGETGSLQLWVENARTEQSRLEKKLDPPDKVAWSRQLGIMSVFDALIQNLDRNQGNILIDRERFHIWLIDHSRAFVQDTQIPQLDKLLRCDRALFFALATFDEAAARAELSWPLTNRELEALLERRRKLLEHFERAIAERGELVVLAELPGQHGSAAGDEEPE